METDYKSHQTSACMLMLSMTHPWPHVYLLK